MKEKSAFFNNTKIRQFIVQFEGFCDNENDESEEVNDIEALIADMILNESNFQESDTITTS